VPSPDPGPANADGSQHFQRVTVVSRETGIPIDSLRAGVRTGHLPGLKAGNCFLVATAFIAWLIDLAVGPDPRFVDLEQAGDTWRAAQRPEAAGAGETTEAVAA
jgi:hypothetical protein